MDKKESKEKFKQAATLYHEGKFETALAMLEELALDHPHHKNIMYSKALCLEGLRRGTEAMELCDELVVHFQDERALDLKTKLLSMSDSFGINRDIGGKERISISKLPGPRMRSVTRDTIKGNAAASGNRTLVIVGVVFVILIAGAVVAAVLFTR